MTKAVFLYGPLAWRPLLTCITGQEAGAFVPDILPDHGLGEAAAPVFSVAFRKADATLDGVVVTDISADAFERLVFFAQALGLECKDVILGSGREAVSVVASEGSDLAPMDLSDWQRDFGDLALEACREAMGYYGSVTTDGLAWRMPMILSRAAARQAAQIGKPADMRSTTPAAQVECIRRHTPHQGYFLTREYRLRYPGFDGGASPLVDREVFVATDAAIVLPYDPVHDRVLLVEQFRMGPYGRGDPRPWMLEPVAGRVDAGETPEQTARRECVEEAGLDLRELELISRHYCTPGTSTEYFHLYLGLCDLPQAGHGLGGLASENEDIRTHVISYDRAMSLLDTGEADNGPLVLALMWLSRERERLRSAA
ncbi:nudix-type nucleoside diphosphatase, YffH/AdpP family [Roseovarius litoreus]|uniref:ADP-ribose pyrophosphatase n=1 Tax=Roseovarius litoreus TaxID=1155722 RepID=A0A1M7D323_9RHOB|nr:NUDIX domain-containing protein [Roseovarius litoreus]SHL73793.1 nudix-type nucleoside diphosphatase, YffH/AdpP family [Roseovarius litoreus]